MNNLKSNEEYMANELQSLTTDDPYRYVEDARAILFEDANPHDILTKLNPTDILDYVKQTGMFEEEFYEHLYERESEVLGIICSDPSDPDRVLPYYDETAIAQYLAERTDATDAHIEFLERLTEKNYRDAFLEMRESDLETLASFATAILKERTDED